jgi:hypothetical protein
VVALLPALFAQALADFGAFPTDRAVELRRWAEGAGYFKDAAHIEQLKRDASREPLRTREGFERLLRRVE